MTEPVAAMDCGSNSTRLLVVDEHGRTVLRDMHITRLSQGVDASGDLLPEAMTRTFDVLARYRDAARAAGATSGLLVATSAVRDAGNGAAFLRGAEEHSGLATKILTGDEEAAFSLAGATMGLAPTDGPTLIVDVGGGSTELASELDGDVVSFSMQLGCVRVAERALGHGLVTAAGERDAVAMIDRELDRAFAAVPAFGALVSRVRLVGLAGTVATLAQLDAGLSVYDRDAVHHRVLSRATVRDWRERLGAETPEVRLTHPGMVKGREDVLVAGLYVLEAVMTRFDVAELLSSENDILDGIVASLQRP